MNNESRENFNHCFKIRKELYGEEHVNSVMALENVAKVLIRTNNLEEARTVLDEAIKIKSTVFGSDHHFLAETYSE